jgi:hypothetical protein
MRDEQLAHLSRMLRRGTIWALNVGENFNTSTDAWRSFCDALPQTRVSYLYVSEHNLLQTDLKIRMRNAIRENRRHAAPWDLGFGKVLTRPRAPHAQPHLRESQARGAVGFRF